MKDISVVLFQRDKWWIAQCLQYDIGAQAMTAQDVLYELQRALVGHIVISQKENVTPLETLPAAPKSYWKLWEGAKITLQYDEQPLRLPMMGVAVPKPEVRMVA